MPATRLLLPLLCAGVLAACDAEPSRPPPVDTADTTAAMPAPATDAPRAADANLPDHAALALAESHELVAGGNEPFWSVEVDGDALVYSTPEQMPGIELEAQRSDLEDTALFTGEHVGTPFTLEIDTAPCQDSMSGWDHPFTASFSWGGQTMTGCARRASDPVGENPR